MLEMWIEVLGRLQERECDELVFAMFGDNINSESTLLLNLLRLLFYQASPIFL